MSTMQPTPPIGSRPISYAPGYRICDYGEVWSCLTIRGERKDDAWHPIKGVPDGENKEYLKVSLRINKKTVGRHIHVLVAEAFIGPCPPGMEVCHNDGNGHNNHVSNLRYDTPKGNAADRALHGTERYGETNGFAKLRDDQIPEMFVLFSQGVRLNEIARRYEISSSEMTQIIHRRTWKHVEVDPSLIPPDVFLAANRRYTDEQVVDIFRRYQSGETQVQIAAIYRTHSSSISTILRRKVYRHVDVGDYAIGTSGSGKQLRRGKPVPA